MALVLSSASITSGQTIRAWHVTQSIDALTGNKAYDITISGSLTVIGPTNITGSVGISNNLDVIGTLTAGELELTNLTVNGIADIATANIDAGTISASFTGSLLGTASYVTGSSVYGPNGSNSVLTASFASTASYVLNAVSSSFALSASKAVSASWAPMIPAGNNTEIQFNSGSTLKATGSFKFNYLSQSLEQGFNVTASGLYSHAEGIDTKTLSTGIVDLGGIGPASDYVFQVTIDPTSYISNGNSYEFYDGATNPTLTVSNVSGDLGGYWEITTNEISNIYTILGVFINGIGQGSHTEGIGTIAVANYQHVQGMYNITSSTAQGAFILGNGTDDSNRSNLIFAHGNEVQITGSLQVTNGIYGSVIGSLSGNVFGNLTGTASYVSTLRAAGDNTEIQLNGGNILNSSANFTFNTSLFSFRQGLRVTASGQYSFSQGFENIASGLYAHAQGQRTLASGQSSHAEGFNTLASNNMSHAEGYLATASGQYAHAEGEGSIASNTGAHAEGRLSIASGLYAHAEGEQTLASNSVAHAEGYFTTASGQYSHAEGSFTKALGNGSHAEGFQTTAVNDFSHAEGRQTIASGSYSHAEGRLTIAIEEYSHAEGLETIASGAYQTVVGQYNAQNNTTDRFIVGTGTISSRKDGFSVTHSGSIIVSTQSAAPTWTGREGEIVPANVSGTYRIYVYIGGAWRSSSLS